MITALALAAFGPMLLMAASIYETRSRTDLDRVNEAACCLYAEGRIDRETAERYVADAMARQAPTASVG